jgi:hypothetical protein
VVRDDGEVTLAGGEGQLPPGREHADVVLQHGAFATEDGARSRYTLHGVRNEDGSISFVWEAWWISWTRPSSGRRCSASRR